MEQKEYDFIISTEEKEARIDVFLSKKLGLSRALIQKLIDGRSVTVNNAAVKHHYWLKQDDRVIVNIPPPKPSKVAPQDIPLKIVYQDSDIAVIDKPAGMVAHPTSSVREGTLVNALLHAIGDLSSVGGELKPGIVHRLDKDTSGLLVVAKNDKAHLSLQKQIKDRRVKKIYRALVFGEIKPREGVIEKPIGRHPVHRKKMAVILSGRSKSRHATTFYRVIRQYKKYALLELDLKTGRTHQIRVHLSYLGYPIVGDAVYSSKKNDIGANRQLLHSYMLGFEHPATGKYMEFKSDIPDDFSDALKRLE